jgi:serine/threonine protein kinase
MAPLPSCPPPERWRQHLDGTATPGEQAELTAHLDICAACRRTLDALAAGGDSLLGLARQMGDQPARTEGAAVPQPGLATSAETLHEAAARVEKELDFLTTPAKPGHLGRLGHYEVLELIGKGAFGIVLKAFDEKLHRMVAIKVLSPQLASSGTARKRFTREAQAAAAVAHEHVVTIHAVEDEHNPPYLVMQFIDGVSLQEKLDEKGPLGLKEILRIGLQTAEGLAAAHKQGLVHRDIKPANILLENGVERVKITDFGLARAVDDASLTQSGVVAGTPMYMSPEQAEGLTIDHRSDLFSLGTVLYAMCTGRPPFRATGTMAVLKRVIEDTPRPIREINSEIPNWLVDIIGKLHAKKPEERYPSAREVAEVLGQHLAELQAHGSVLSAQVETPKPLPRRRSWKVAALVGLLLLGALGLTLALWQPWKQDSPTVAPPHKDSVRPPPTNTITDGWVQLFNGKDLSGWRTHPTQPGNWMIEGRSLVGRGPKASHLFSERGDYRDFHLRVEAKLNASGDSGVGFRAPFGLPFSFAGASLHGGFEANIVGDGSRVMVGELCRLGGKPLLAHVVVSPDVWFTLEVIAVGDRILVRVNGQTTADYVVTNDEPARGHVVLQAFTPDTVVRYRKIAIKELPPNPTARQPFVVLARDDRAEQAFPTLKDAVEKAQSGDTIEVRGDGPFQCEPADAGTKALCIRAGEGSRPLLLGGKQHRPTLSTRGPLVLEGLEMRREAVAAVEARNVWASDQPVCISHCRFLTAGEQMNVTLDDAPAATIQHTQLLARTWGCVSWFGKRRGAILSIKQSVLSAGDGGLLCGLKDENRSLAQLEVRFRANTVVGVGNLGNWFVFQTLNPSAFESGKEAATAALRLELNDNLVVSSLLGGVQHQHDTGVGLEAMEAFLKKQVRWSGARNRFAGGSAGLQFSQKGKVLGVPLKDLKDWKSWWGQESPFEPGVVKFSRADLVAQLVNGETPQPVEFRAVGDAAKFGAGVDRVGPGKPYEEWKKTPEYRQWKDSTDRLLSGK